MDSGSIVYDRGEALFVHSQEREMGTGERSCRSALGLEVEAVFEQVVARID